ncbi:TerD family protein, partial [Streptomyces sp. NPDC006992]|uniref:TerD family protein n=1 Tax=Streptomyces sp. NPDC006992 TaxID=3155601 RepID=UPI0033D0C925
GERGCRAVGLGVEKNNPRASALYGHLGYRDAPAAPAGTGKINLDKGRVSLQKNQTVSLVKGGRPLLTSVRMGLGWEPVFRAGRRAKEIDLDASVIAYDANRKKVDACYFGKLAILGGVIQHSGDNLTGEGEGDDEVITVHLGDIPPQVTGLVFTVNSFSGQKFTDVAKAYCRLLDGGGGELVRFDLTQSEPRTGVLMAKFIRQFSGEWEMTALGEYVDSRTVRGMVKPGAAAL